jgi:hypothetical protein
MDKAQQIARELLIANCENNGDTIDAYSGRGMCGEQCVSIKNSDSSLTTLMFDLGMQFREWLDSATAADLTLADDVCRALQSVREDALGMRSVFYWPRLSHS